MSIFCRVDDKHVPLYRVMWISATPHYCGEEDCVREGWTVWGNQADADYKPDWKTYSYNSGLAAE